MDFKKKGGEDMEEKAQGALEYLLLIGGAVLVAAIVLSLLTGLATTGAEGSNAGTESIHGSLQTLNDLT